MKTYLRFISALLGLSYIAGIVFSCIYLRTLSGKPEFVWALVGLIVGVFVGPALCFLFWKVADLLEENEKLKDMIENNSSALFKEDDTSFVSFKSFEVIKEIESLENKPLVVGQTGIVEEETNELYKCFLYINEKKINLSFSKDETGIKVFDCVRTKQDLVTPKGDIIEKGKVGLVKKTANGKDKIVVFNEGTPSETKILIKKTYLK